MLCPLRQLSIKPVSVFFQSSSDDAALLSVGRLNCVLLHVSRLFILPVCFFQAGVPAFTVKQPEDAMAVLRDRAKEIGVSVRSRSSAAKYLVGRPPPVLTRSGVSGCSAPYGCVPTWTTTRRTAALCDWAWRDSTSAPTPPWRCS